MGKRKDRRSFERRLTTALIVLLAAVTLALGGYVAGWYANRARTREDAKRYQTMYTPQEAASTATVEPGMTTTPAGTPVVTATPGPTSSPMPTATITATPTVTITPTVTATPTPTPTPTATVTPTPTPTFTLTPAPTSTPTVTPTSTPTATPAPTATPLPTDPVAVDVPLTTPGADTLILSLPTPPPVQESFAALLAHNPDTVGYLELPDMLSLPVVQRLNDNDHYLTHSFDGVAAEEGALFLDGINRLTPEDDCLIVYGHNMKNGSMFGPLHLYGDGDYLRAHPLVRFDTLYENRTYVPVAAFAASTDPADARYFDVRQFLFDETGFELYTLRLQARSLWPCPVDLRYGDRLLLLVTCDYTAREGRFILALRQLRPDEEAEAVAQRVRESGRAG